MIELDGSQGEGGGQILRTALTLSMITGRPFRIVHIRANRAQPGLRRQHLVAVQAAARVCGAELGDIGVGSRTLEFAPGRITGGHYDFDIGTAGSSTLVLQTLLPALWHADRPSTVRVIGGTHNPMAPPAQFLQRAYARLLVLMGACVELWVRRFGFYPAGGGELWAQIQPCPRLQPVELMQRGEPVAQYAESIVAGIPPQVAQRELDCVRRAMGWSDAQLRAIAAPPDQGPGNALLITLEYRHVTEVFSAIGEKRRRAEEVALQAIREAQHYLRGDAAVGEHLADQLMIPLALAGDGRFTTIQVSQHTRTNADVISAFLPVHFAFDEQAGIHVCSVHPA